MDATEGTLRLDTKSLRARLPPRRLLALLVLALALLSKESAVVFPAAALLVDRLRGERLRFPWYGAYGAVALAYTVRDYLMDRWRKTANTYYSSNPKFVYYLSAEYLLGRQLTQNMLYTDTWDLANQALAEEGLLLSDIIELDPEPGLGNGGLGRLAAGAGGGDYWLGGCDW